MKRTEEESDRVESSCSASSDYPATSSSSCGGSDDAQQIADLRVADSAPLLLNGRSPLKRFQKSTSSSSGIQTSKGYSVKRSYPCCEFATLEEDLEGKQQETLEDDFASLGLGDGRDVDSASSPATSSSGSSSCSPVDLSSLKMEEQDLTLLIKIGRGGFATVYKATWRGVIVAVKMVKTLNEESWKEAFFDEIRALAVLRSPNIVLLMGYTYTTRFCCIVTQLIEGPSLSEVILSPVLRHRDGSLRIREAIEICQGIIDAMLVVVNRGLVHGDLKPENVLVEGVLDLNSLSKLPKLKPILIDFGLASKIHALGRKQRCDIGGTPAYCAPEFWEDPASRPSEATDVYAFGILFLEVITGACPWSGLKPQEIANRVAETNESPISACNVKGLSCKLIGIAERCTGIANSRPNFRQLKDEFSMLMVIYT